MNANELKAEMVRCDFTIPKLAEHIGIGKKALYAKINGDSDFKQSEIMNIAQCLNLDNDAIFKIFFAK